MKSNGIINILFEFEFESCFFPVKGEKPDKMPGAR